MTAVANELDQCHRTSPRVRPEAQPDKFFYDDTTSPTPGMAGPTSANRMAGEEAILRRHLQLARAVASRYRGRGIDFEDLEQVANLGLLKAIRRFDPDLGFNFLSFAVPTIRGEVQRYFRDHGWAVRPPRRIQETQARVVSADAELTQLLGSSPTASDIAAHLDLDVALVVEAMSSRGCFTPLSLDAQHGSTRQTLGDSVGAEDVELQQAEARAVVAGAVRQLCERDLLIVELRFFRGWTQKEIGDELGITQVQVSRLLERIFTQLRNKITPSDITRLPPRSASAVAASAKPSIRLGPQIRASAVGHQAGGSESRTLPVDQVRRHPHPTSSQIHLNTANRRKAGSMPS